MARPAMSAAARATSGAAKRHGPHHAAQKSTSTGTRAFWIISSNSAESTSSGSSTGGKEDLHAPHCPVSARCSAGMRFLCPQALQARITGMHTSLPRVGMQFSLPEAGFVSGANPGLFQQPLQPIQCTSGPEGRLLLLSDAALKRRTTYAWAHHHSSLCLVHRLASHYGAQH